MLPANPVLVATYGTLFTFLCTAFGAAVVFLGRGKSKKDSKDMQSLCFGFASGVMMAASVWSLLMPAMESAESQGASSMDSSGRRFSPRRIPAMDSR